jgi:hypothetical protein
MTKRQKGDSETEMQQVLFLLREYILYNVV